MNTFRYLKIAAVAAAVFFTACRGQTSEKSPIHPNMNMDQQNRVEAQEYNAFFSDNRAMRQPVDGTVARGGLRQDKALYQGINEDSSFIQENPVEVNKEFLLRGQDQYDIYCTPCHGITGDGQGVIVTGGYGLVPPPSYHMDRLRNEGDGYLYSVITNGIRTMKPYAHQISVKDRWAIVAYIRALQRSQNVPESEMQEYNIDLASMKDEAREQLASDEARKKKEEAASAGAEVSAAKGKQLAETNTCTTCHSADGSELTGPTWQNLYGYEQEMADGSTVLADEDYLTESIVNSTAKTVKGFAEGSMADFSYLSSSDVDNIIAYIKSLSDKSPEEESGAGSQGESTDESAETESAGTEAAGQPTKQQSEKSAAQPDKTTENNEKAQVQQQFEDTAKVLSASAQSGKLLVQEFECLSCHYLEDTKEDLAPTFKGLYGSVRKLEGDSSVIADPGYLKESIQYPGAKIALGYNNNMPSYRDLLSDPELQAISDYLKTLR